MNKTIPLLSLLFISSANASSAPDFASFTDVNEKKMAFFSYLAPMIEAENKKILEDRGVLILGQDKDSIQRICEEYSSNCNPVSQDKKLELLNKVDVIPPALVLAQAANESAWGTSRFAKQANNYFGQWCFTKGCGLVPARRDSGATHEVRRFSSVDASVSSYMMNLNTNRAYEELRQERAFEREAGTPINAQEMAKGLSQYSSRGMDYVEEITAMIEYNKLEEKYPLHAQ
ncbi:glucosaminidase domain-containing protein [uncultured Vibrio sp.]|uniref:glucosaminidase domain-containing protein n=1 Tax=uncultured Vibrio sp. TaxID=114054 RepID=UPI002602E939|nr:glucosaminidase domain-containing protein [uncultured Vibrio sp.]